MKICKWCSAAYQSNDRRRKYCSPECYQEARREQVRECQREYQQRPEVKARRREWFREYNQRPERKAYNREYNQRPERKAYNQRPERKAYNREYNQRPERKAANREYNQRPERKAYNREYHESFKDGCWHVYMRVNIENGMIYFGCTSRPEARWQEQDCKMRAGSPAQAGLPEEMISDFQRGDRFYNQILFSYKDKESALEMERWLIERWHDHAYNRPPPHRRIAELEKENEQLVVLSEEIKQMAIEKMKITTCDWVYEFAESVVEKIDEELSDEV